MVEQVEVKLPNAMTAGELMAKGMTAEQADAKMHDLVFGVGHTRDKDGKVIERGKGGPLQQTHQHLEALRILNENKAAKGKPISATDIGAAVAAAVKSVQAPQGAALDAASIAAIVAATVKSVMEEVNASAAKKAEEEKL